MSENKNKLIQSVLKACIVIIGLSISAQTYSQGTGSTNRPESKQVALLINQVGYDVNGEKILVVQVRDSINKEAGTDFQLINKSGKTVFSGKLISKGRVNKDWGARYWSGDFSQLKAKGEYRAKIKVGDDDYFSFSFHIDQNFVAKETIMPAEHFFWYQRCGFAVPGLHPACHMDDGRIPDSMGGGHIEAAGGWHDAGDFNKYATIACRSVYALLIAARDIPKTDLSEKSRKEILGEGLWGSEWLLKMCQPGKGIIYQEVWNSYDYSGTPDKETDNTIGTKDDRPFRGEGPSAMTAAALAVAAKTTGRKDFREAAEDLWKGAVKIGTDYPEDIWGNTSGTFANLGEDDTGRIVRRTADLLLADIELEALTGEKQYDRNAQSCIEYLAHVQKTDGLWPSDVYSRTALQGVPPASLALYAHTHPGTESSVIATKALRLWVDGLSQLTNNPFGLIPWAKGAIFNPNLNKSPGKEYYYVGQNSQYLSNAWALYLTASVLKDPLAADLANRQLDWILGVNPFNLSMLEGKGSFNSPKYLHWAPDNDRGAVPGAIPNGFCRFTADKDTPWFDLYDIQKSYHTAEPWEPHNAFYILAVSARANVMGNK